eukprot:GHVU01224882.1.p1 GENE.GHVU01224882.1~~GHVU01224882.1.p1  ORF type:complete len:154 (+),score=41.68 GHVU01224882.1:86-547(+)
MDREIQEARQMAMEYMKNKVGTEDATRIGGKGTQRRKKRVQHRPPPADEKKLQSALAKLGLSKIAGIEEVTMIREDGSSLKFTAPKVSAVPQANTYVITGAATEGTVQDFLNESAELYKALQMNKAVQEKEEPKIEEINDDVPDFAGDFENPS